MPLLETTIALAVFDVGQRPKAINLSLRADNIAFTVVILPLFIPYEAWPADARASRERILQVVKDLGVAYFDLLVPLNEATKKGIIIQESKGDLSHPSQ